MKKLILLSLLAVACASHKQQEVPQFDKLKVCSDTSLAYMAKSTREKPASPKIHTEAEIQNRMINLEPLVRKCYENFLNVHKTAAFNVCFVVGYTKQGKQEYFEFSSKEFDMPEDLKNCLSSIKTSRELEGLKNVSILQPFKLYPVH